MTTRAASISIITPNFNHARYLERCIKSVAMQTCPVFEHIVVDDGSIDDSRDILQKLAQQYPSLRVALQDSNQGVARTIERAIIEAKGDFILTLAADDALLEHSIERFANVIAANPHTGYVCGEVEFVRGGKSWHRRYITADKPVYLSPDELVFHQKSMLKVISGAAVVRRDLALASSICDPHLAWFGDMIAYTSIAYRWGVWYIPEIVHRFTISETNSSKKAQIWKLEKPALEHVFKLLNSEVYADIRGHFRESAVLAEFPLILRYMVSHPATWYFLTFRVFRNAAIFFFYRKIRSLFSQRLIDAYIRGRSRHGKVQSSVS